MIKPLDDRDPGEITDARWRSLRRHTDGRRGLTPRERVQAVDSKLNLLQMVMVTAGDESKKWVLSICPTLESHPVNVKAPTGESPILWEAYFATKIKRFAPIIEGLSSEACPFSDAEKEQMRTRYQELDNEFHAQFRNEQRRK